ncbi:MAG: protease modulator HflC [Candidatus Auribacterota bacterium]|nr:protease modulator HflC [Candidatus Auribacterota bacterium]
MKLAAIILVGVLVLVGILFMVGWAYVLPETHQVVITQFGNPVGAPIAKAGLHFKKPFIQKARYFEKRLLAWDGDPNQVPTMDKKFIWVDTTARWKISDSLKFLQTVGNETGAQSKLDDIINSATRDAITNRLLVEVVRDSNRIIENDEIGEEMIVMDETLESIETGRKQLEEKILKTARKLAPQYGIEVVDVRIKRLNYVQEVRNDVYNRMIAERKQAAASYRAEGHGKRAEIDGQREKELKKITSRAYRTAQGLKGKADAKVTKIYAAAYNEDPEFYGFLKTLETYRKTIDSDTTLILTTEDEYYQHLKGPGKDSKQ